MTFQVTIEFIGLALPTYLVISCCQSTLIHHPCLQDPESHSRYLRFRTVRPFLITAAGDITASAVPLLLRADRLRVWPSINTGSGNIPGPGELLVGDSANYDSPEAHRHRLSRTDRNIQISSASSFGPEAKTLVAELPSGRSISMLAKWSKLWHGAHGVTPAGLQLDTGATSGDTLAKIDSVQCESVPNHCLPIEKPDPKAAQNGSCETESLCVEADTSFNANLRQKSPGPRRGPVQGRESVPMIFFHRSLLDPSGQLQPVKQRKSMPLLLDGCVDLIEFAEQGRRGGLEADVNGIAQNSAISCAVAETKSRIPDVVEHVQDNDDISALPMHLPSSRHEIANHDACANESAKEPARTAIGTAVAAVAADMDFSSDSANRMLSIMYKVYLRCANQASWTLNV